MTKVFQFGQVSITRLHDISEFQAAVDEHGYVWLRAADGELICFTDGHVSVHQSEVVANRDVRTVKLTVTTEG